MRSKKKSTNKYQHKLIVLISTLNYVNLNLEQYTQNDILHYFNGNMKRNGQKPIKLKTLQNYLYKLEKIFKVTKNYHRHLGVNMGTEIYYSLKYTKKECYRTINKHFRDKKKNRYKNRVNDYLKKTCIKNGSVEKWECSYNIYNNKEEEKNKKSIEKLHLEKYAKKCKFKSKEFYSILDLKIDKDSKIELLKIFKRTENYFESKNDGKANTNQSKSEIKKKELSRMLNETKCKLESEGYNSDQLKTQIQKVYEQYKHKPHFIIENNKYNDLRKITEKLKKSVEYVKKSIKEDLQNIRNNIFSILLEQLRYKVDIKILVPRLKNYLDKQNKLTYNKVFNNQYYQELLTLVENEENYLKSGEFEKITS
ncbi:plasmid maintenance protein (plasmid) [Borrelia miyamotoi]|uniref:Plasmid maintenance protein n=1 Tax=Borrelia miyamotoi TaxID=47466 RepID=A0A481YFJ5_9SPIR|nr:plasmid maintenance protein [Borrelia miyamotoi]QBK62636.1 hypothetical protein EZU67_05725 [Borrelia miyamotoi]QBK65194.1 hypothetical protein EZU69_05875 [Borrelia miyamotoi]WCB91131.1 plasmid maintenance protein [Borrelia miyamotoi]WDE70497.1 plasmid maintenance protein [Borrelia miyamotoi]WDE71852.1 plasmid maintenance protein [Borrelia miyamotoi]